MQTPCSPPSTSLHGGLLCTDFTPPLLHVLMPPGLSCLNANVPPCLGRCPFSIHYSTYHIVSSFTNVTFMMANQSQVVKELVLVTKTSFQLRIIFAKEHDAWYYLKSQHETLLVWLSWWSDIPCT